ncbi:hypothetical protein [Nocardioides sp.]|uniref:hypothetical protein n=1 Tax=Nocardioides sp. TaxID=35761 RepID=UPI001A1810A4|nr:hypothetical protein [Nocardioides sp.]MBJ7356008.1 hypothetical protein [Nocardioides sp.]
MEAARATSFGGWAEEYDAWRPSYPDAAVDWLVPPGASQVVEVGAGLVARACAASGAATAPLTFDALCVRWYPDG